MKFEVAPQVITLGWIIALIVLVLAVIFAVLAQIPLLVAALIAGVAIARLL